MSEQQKTARLSFLVTLLMGLCLAPEVGYPQSGKVIVLEHADSLVGKVIDGQDARELIGNVRFSQENVHVSCDRALEFRASGRVHLTGNVVVRDEEVTLRAPRGMFYREERRAEAFEDVQLDDGRSKLTARYGEYFVEPKRAFFRGEVVVQDSATTLRSDSLIYFRTEKRSIALGSVEIHNSTDNLTIKGQHFESLNNQQFSRMTMNPVMVQFDTSLAGEVDTLVVRSRVMESYQDSVKCLVAIDSVRIVRSDLASVAGLAVFYTKDDSILLRKSPLIWYQQTQVSGDSINVYLEQRRLKRVLVMGNAKAISRSDSLHPERFDQITGKQIQMHFERQMLERIEVETQAISIYHLYEDSLANGLNMTSGDRMTILFDRGKVKSIAVYGGVEGQYIPENMVKGREREHTIPGFHWREDRPIVHAEELAFRRTRLTQ